MPRETFRNKIMSVVFKTGKVRDFLITDEEEIVGNKHFLKVFIPGTKDSAWMSTEEIVSFVDIENDGIGEELADGN